MFSRINIEEVVMVKKFLVLLLMLFPVKLSFAEGAIELEQIVVTPFLEIEGESIYSIPYAVKDFSKEDIKKTGAENITGFLRRVSSVNVSDWYGTGVKANVDLMGFGDNSLSNILVLVNGRRINDIDLSGIDWAQIPLNNVDSIEIIKGGGGVLYGDNSSGGIINIITKKKIPDEFQSEINIEGGSYSSDKESFNFTGKEGIISYSLYSEHISTDGYRKNSQYRSKYANMNINAEINDDTGISFEFGHHRYRYGLPGALYESDLSSGFSRRDSKYPNDNSRMEDNYITGSFKKDFSDNLKLLTDITYRNKNGVDNWLSYGIWNDVVDKHINSVNLTSRFIFKADTLGLRHKIISGFDIFSADFSADTNYLHFPGSDNYTDIDRTYKALFFNDTINLNDKLSFSTGARIQREKFSFDYCSSFLKIDDNLDFSEESYEAGANYKLSENKNIFINFSRGFRVPKTDEYFSAFASPPVNKNLLPQISKSIVAGTNLQFGSISLSSDIFIMYLDNEIYYNPLTYANENYDRTKHEGADVSFTFNVSKNTEVSAGYRFTEAKFEKGAYMNREVPAVPHSKVNISFSHVFFNRFTFNLDALYRSKMYLINDINNTLDKLSSFWVANAKLSFKMKNIEIYAGINNLFNERYSEYASTNSSATVRALYPSPGRNCFFGTKIKF